MIIRPFSTERKPYAILEEFRAIGRYVGDEILKKNRSLVLSGEGVENKNDDNSKRVDWVTKSDRESEKTIFENLKKRYKYTVIIGEEDKRYFPATIRFIGHTFLFDPLDGTGIYGGGIQDILKDNVAKENVARLSIKPKPNDFQKYGVFLNFSIENNPLIDYAYFPETREEIFATKGNGAFYIQLDKPKSPIRLSVSDTMNLDAAVASYSLIESVLSDQYLNDYKEFIEAMQHFPVNRVFGFTSAVYESCATTFPGTHNEKTDVFVIAKQYQWDHPSLIVKEAHGKSVLVVHDGNKLVLKSFSYDYFNNLDLNDNTFKKPYALVTGNPWLVDKFCKTLEERL